MAKKNAPEPELVSAGGFQLVVKPPVDNDKGLKRWMIHDSRAWDHRAFTGKVPALPTTAVYHKRNVPIFDQGQIGSCTANADLGCLSCDPLWDGKTQWTESDAQDLYRKETRLDDSVIPGHWEPDDTGSTGWYGFKALKQAGRVSSYGHAFGIKAAIAVLAQKPISIGIDFYDCFEDPDKNNYYTIQRGAQVVGGHQMCVRAFDPGANGNPPFVVISQSWGADYGDHGEVKMTVDTLDKLLRAGGDVCYANV
jgi:hypothetical protein